MGHVDDALGRFRVHQDLRLRMLLAQQLQLQALELVVHDAGAVPHQHVGAGLFLDVAAQVAVGRPQDFLAAGMQVGHDLQRAGTGHHPVGPGLHGGAGVGVDDDLAVRVGVAKTREVIRRAAQVQRAGRVQVGHQHALFGAEDLGRLAHEAHAGHHQGLGGMVAAEAGHFQRVGHAAAGGQREVLQRAVDVVVGDEHGVVLLQQRRRTLGQALAVAGRQRGRHLGPGMRGGAGAGGVLLGVVEKGLGHLHVGRGDGRSSSRKCRAAPARARCGRLKPLRGAAPVCQAEAGSTGQLPLMRSPSNSSKSPNCSSTASLCRGRKNTWSSGCKSTRPEATITCWLLEAP
mmetsp:Transcript_6218/g.25153  ORF Transcript_6218/g.25153 Transcript_6218/m.25153 type:complete len:345 (-) Transcript_6218:315-1349(-)